MSTKRWIILVLTCIFAILIFVGVFWLSGVSLSKVKIAVWQAGFVSLTMVVAAMIAQMFLQALSWTIMIDGSGHRIDFDTALAAIFVGWAGNFITPSMYMGGEPVRAFVLSKSNSMPFGKTLVSVLAHKFLEGVSFILFMLFSATLVFYRFHAIIPWQLQIAIIFVLSVLVILFSSIFFALYYRKKLLSNLVLQMIHWNIAASFLSKNRDKIVEMEEYLLQIFVQAPLRCIHSLAWMILFHMLVFIRPWLFFTALGMPFDMGKLALLFLLIQLLHALQFTPGGLGIVEGGMIGVFALIQIPGAQAVGFAMFCRLGDLIIVSIGLVLPLYYAMLKPAVIRQQWTENNQ